MNVFRFKVHIYYIICKTYVSYFGGANQCIVNCVHKASCVCLISRAGVPFLILLQNECSTYAIIKYLILFEENKLKNRYLIPTLMSWIPLNSLKFLIKFPKYLLKFLKITCTFLQIPFIIRKIYISM